MLKWDTLRATQRAFSGIVKQVVVNLGPRADNHHLLVGLKDEMILKKTLERRSTKKIVEEVVVGPSVVLRVRKRM